MLDSRQDLGEYVWSIANTAMVAMKFGGVVLQWRVPAAIAVLACLSILAAPVDAEESRVPEVVSARPFLRSGRPGFQSYALVSYQNYPNHYAPYDDAPLRFYGPLGSELITGYDLYRWRETRTPGQEYGSSIFKPNLIFFDKFNHKSCCKH